MSFDRALDDIMRQSGDRDSRSTFRGRGEMKAVDGRSGGGPLRRGGRRIVETPYTRGNVEARWKHDLYDPNPAPPKPIPDDADFTSEPARPARTSLRVTRSLRSAGGKLLVSNLPTAAGDLDIKDLFRNVGAVTKAVVHYDSSGRSLGTADVFFATRAEAVDAVHEYNGLSFEGRSILVSLASSEGEELDDNGFDAPVSRGRSGSDGELRILAGRTGRIVTARSSPRDDDRLPSSRSSRPAVTRGDRALRVTSGSGGRVVSGSASGDSRDSRSRRVRGSGSVSAGVTTARSLRGRGEVTTRDVTAQLDAELDAYAQLRS